MFTELTVGIISWLPVTDSEELVPIIQSIPATHTHISHLSIVWIMIASQFLVKSLCWLLVPSPLVLDSSPGLDPLFSGSCLFLFLLPPFCGSTCWKGTGEVKLSMLWKCGNVFTHSFNPQWDFICWLGIKFWLEMISPQMTPLLLFLVSGAALKKFQSSFRDCILRPHSWTHGSGCWGNFSEQSR